MNRRTQPREPRDGLRVALAEAADTVASEGTRDAAREASRRHERVRRTELPVDTTDTTDTADPTLDAARERYRRAAFARAIDEMNDRGEVT